MRLSIMQLLGIFTLIGIFGAFMVASVYAGGRHHDVYNYYDIINNTVYQDCYGTARVAAMDEVSADPSTQRPQGGIGLSWNVDDISGKECGAIGAGLAKRLKISGDDYGLISGKIGWNEEGKTISAGFNWTF